MKIRYVSNYVVKKVSFFFCCSIISLLFLIAIMLLYKARAILAITSLKGLLFSLNWFPAKGEFGLASFIIGSLWVTAIAIIIAVPFSIFTAIYIAEYATKRIKNILAVLIDLLAGISPVVYGVWGIIAIVPLIGNYLMPFLSEKLNFFPFSSDNYTGYSSLAGGIVLSVMIFPIIISVIYEVIESIPFEMREASFALGFTKWETVKYVVLRKAKAGIIAAIILGLSRAFGETMAVLMVAGCSLYGYPKSLFDPAYPLPALIANTYGDMMSIPLYDSAIMLAALFLMLITSFFSMIGWGILIYISKRGN